MLDMQLVLKHTKYLDLTKQLVRNKELQVLVTKMEILSS